MISLSSISVSARKFILLIVTASIVFLLFQASFQNGNYQLSSLARLSGLDPNATLGVAEKIYVLSLPRRTDRRREMEKLKKALGLRWKYINALDMKTELVEKILDSVRAIRATNNEPFIWPADTPPPDEDLSKWSPGYPPLLTKVPSSRPPEPMLCATNNNSVKFYEPGLPEFLILTPARVACWYSHLSVIQTVANDKSLKDNDTVIVLEDDVDMERDIHARLKHVWTYLPNEWDIVYLGHCWSDEAFHPALNAHDNTTYYNGSVTYIHPSKNPACNHGYALTRSGARRILVHLRYPPFAYSRAIDLAITWLIRSNRIKSFSLYPSIVIQRKTSNSDIMPGTGSDWKDTLVNGVFSVSEKDAPK